MGQTHTTEDAAANPYVDGVDGRNPWLDAPEDDSPALSADESAKPAGTSRASMLLPPFLRNRKRDADTDQRGRVVKRRVGTDLTPHTPAAVPARSSTCSATSGCSPAASPGSVTTSGA
jgi:hypothetical protein